MKGIEKLTTINFAYSNNTFTGKLQVDRMDFDPGPDSCFMIGKDVSVEILAKTF